jgi:hypothetical protein
MNSFNIRISCSEFQLTISTAHENQLTEVAAVCAVFTFESYTYASYS